MFMGIPKSEHSNLINKIDRYKNYVWISPPKIFSMVDNTEKSIQFISKLERCFSDNKKVFVDLSSVTDIGHGALVVLLSIMMKFKFNSIDFNGYMPKDTIALQILKSSGFFQELYAKKGHRGLSDTYKLEKHHFFTHANKIVDASLSSDIISSISKLIWGKTQRCPKLQRVYIELMQNTNNHASLEGHGMQHWWTTANYDPERNTGCFSFIDYGVGILSSLKEDKKGKLYKALDKVKQIFQPNSNADFLRLLMTGEIHRTASGKYFRGKGLPGIYQACVSNQISRLVVISNNTMANFANNTFTILRNEFSGTFVYWELAPENNHID